MAKVCEDWYPMGSYKGQRSPGFYMHNTLKANLDALLKNVKKDWDFVICITAGGAVRYGKSVIALQIGMYWTYMLWKLYGIKVPFNTEQNIVYQGVKLIEQGNDLGIKHKNSVLIFDEAGADLEGVKVMQKTTQAVKDFLRECGQYNMLTILVLPEFFDLPKGIAMSRSNFLIDCFVTAKDDQWERGWYNFFSRPNKKMLYMKGKRDLNYRAHKEDFHGDFDDVYPREVMSNEKGFYLNGGTKEFEDKYRKLKQEALKSRAEVSTKELKTDEWLKASVTLLYENQDSYDSTAQLISSKSKIPIGYRTVARIVKGERGSVEQDKEEN